MIPTDHLEIIVGAGVVAALVMTTVATVVGGLTYLIFRERPHRVPATRTAVPRTAPARDRREVAVPAAVAG
jgi:hypothetical protein